MLDTITHFAAGDLAVQIHPDFSSLGEAAARELAKAVKAAIESRGSARIVLATGNSQFPLMTSLARESLPWDRVSVFHMDEYVGIGASHPASFRRWIHERVEVPFRPAHVEYIAGDATVIDRETDRYEASLRAAPIDAVCMGIGENGHLAFNEPIDCDFSDQRWVRRIQLQEASRRQQVNEGHFPDIAAVPDFAITLTIPALLSAARVIVSAPEARKSAAVRQSLTGDVTTTCPASILQRTPQAVLLLDRQSASELPSR